MAGSNEAKTECRTPNGGASTNIPSWKYDVSREIILELLAEHGKLPFSKLAALAKLKLEACLEADQLKAYGSVGWVTTTVKLEMEVAGDIRRLPDTSPQIIEAMKR